MKYQEVSIYVNLSNNTLNFSYIIKRKISIFLRAFSKQLKSHQHNRYCNLHIYSEITNHNGKLPVSTSQEHVR
jgi:hypothetical protein